MTHAFSTPSSGKYLSLSALMCPLSFRQGWYQPNATAHEKGYSWIQQPPRQTNWRCEELRAAAEMVVRVSDTRGEEKSQRRAGKKTCLGSPNRKSISSHSIVDALKPIPLFRYLYYVIQHCMLSSSCKVALSAQSVRPSCA